MLPGWESLEATSIIAKVFMYLGWFALFSLVPLEIIAHIYQEHEKTLSTRLDAERSEAAKKKAADDVADVEWRLTPYVFDGEAQQRVRAKAEPFSGVTFSFVTDPDKLAFDLTEKIATTIARNGANWNPSMPPPPNPSATSKGLSVGSPMATYVMPVSVSGVLIEYPPDGTPDPFSGVTPKYPHWRSAATALAEALTVEGIPSRTELNRKSEQLRITVGRKGPRPTGNAPADAATPPK